MKRIGADDRGSFVAVRDEEKVIRLTDVSGRSEVVAAEDVLAVVAAVG